MLVALGMLLVMTVTVFALRDITGALSLSTNGVAEIFAEFDRIWMIEKNLAGMSLAAHNFVEDGDNRHRKEYEVSRARVKETLAALADQPHSPAVSGILASLTATLDRITEKTERIFFLRERTVKKRALDNPLVDLDRLIERMGVDIDQFREGNAMRMGALSMQLLDNKARVNILFIAILIASVAFLVVFEVFLHQRVSKPLHELWKGTGEISRGNLDHRIQLHGDHDIELLGNRFNEMSQKLKQSYSDLEHKLLDRTRELAALDAVALTLNRAGNLKDMLHKSLLQVMDSMAGLEARGGVFLCDPDGEHLRLTVHHGLPDDFVAREETIRMGECLCGIVARTGEMMVTDHECEDPRHTRSKGSGAHAHIIIPIRSRGIVLGVMFLYPGKAFTLRPSDIQMLDAIGAQLGMAVENFRFYAEVKASSENYWDLFENSRDILFTMDRNGKLTAVNRAAERLSGYSKVELVGKNILDFLTPDGATLLKQLLSSEIRTRQNIEFEVVKRDNTRAFVEVNVRKLSRNRTPGGFHVSARDVTEQRTMRDVILKTERLGAIGQVGVAVRHEINNPLTTVIGNIELLIERYEAKDKDLTARLEIILNNALRIAEIVKRLQEVKQDKVIEYLKGVKMTDLK